MKKLKSFLLIILTLNFYQLTKSNIITDKVKDFASDASRSILRKALSTLDTYKNLVNNNDATIGTYSNALQEEETNLIARKNHVISALNALNISSQTNDPNLKVALCLSGGGYRAMIISLGFFEALENIKLNNEYNFLDIPLYVAALSGSTWATSSWIFGYLNNQTLSDVITNIGNNIGKYSSLRPCISNLACGLPPLTADGITEMKQFIISIISKIAFDQNTSLINYYGALVLNDVLRGTNNRLLLTQSEQSKAILSGKYPLPIYTSVSRSERMASMGGTSTDYDWFGFTPYNISSNTIKAGGVSLPIYAFGRKFKFQDNNLISESINGQYPIPFNAASLLGLYGSAFSVDFGFLAPPSFDEQNLKIFQNDTANKIVNTILKPLFSLWNDHIKNKRLTPPIKVPNFVNPNSTIMSFVDAGLDFNLPFPPLLKMKDQTNNRDVDIILTMDASDINKPENYGLEFVKAKNYAQKIMLNKTEMLFPEIPTQTELAQAIVNGQSMFVFPDILNGVQWNPENGPIIIYFPALAVSTVKECLQSGNFCNTSQFQYTLENFNKLKNAIRDAIMAHSDDIKFVLTKAAEVKNGKSLYAKYPDLDEQYEQFLKFQAEYEKERKQENGTQNAEATNTNDNEEYSEMDKNFLRLQAEYEKMQAQQST